MKNLSIGDKNIVKVQLGRLPPRIKAAQQQEMADMMGKLKSVSALYVQEVSTDHQ